MSWHFPDNHVELSVQDNVVSIRIVGTASKRESDGTYTLADCSLVNAEELTDRIRERFGKLSGLTLSRLTIPSEAHKTPEGTDRVTKNEAHRRAAESIVKEMIVQECDGWWRECESQRQPDDMLRAFDATPAQQVNRQGTRREWSGPSLEVIISNIRPQTDWVWAVPHTIVNMRPSNKLAITSEDAMWIKSTNTIKYLAKAEAEGTGRDISPEEADAVKKLVMLSLLKHGFDFEQMGPVEPRFIRSSETAIADWFSSKSEDRLSVEQLGERITELADGVVLPEVEHFILPMPFNNASEDTYAETLLANCTKPRYYVTYDRPLPRLEVKTSGGEDKGLEVTLRAAIRISLLDDNDSHWYDIASSAIRNGLLRSVHQFNSYRRSEESTGVLRGFSDQELAILPDEFMSEISDHVLRDVELDKIISPPPGTNRAEIDVWCSEKLHVRGEPRLRMLCTVVTKKQTADAEDEQNLAIEAPGLGDAEED